MIAALLDHLWQSTLFAVFAGALTLTLRRNRAHLRYRLWFAASMKFLLPFALLTAAGAQLGVLHPHPALAAPPAALAMQQAAEPFARAAVQAPAPAEARSDPFPTLVGPSLVGLWGLGVAAVLGVWWVRWARIRAVVHAARPLALPAPIPVRASAAMLEPGLVGIWRPVLLLPEGIATQLAPAEVDAILAHELSHLRRRDNLTAAMHMLVEALFWFHPLV